MSTHGVPDRNSTEKLADVFAAARTKQFLRYSPAPGETVIDLVSHAGVDSVPQAAFEEVLARMAAKSGLRLEPVGGGFQCLLITLRVCLEEGSRKKTVELELKSSGTTPTPEFSEAVKMLRDATVMNDLGRMTFVDAEVSQVDADGKTRTEKIDLRRYESPAQTKRRPGERLRRSLLLTATPKPELATLKEALKAKKIRTDREHIATSLCHRFEVSVNGSAGWEAFAASCHHQGNDSAAATAATLVAELKPEVLVLAGIAASLNPKDAKLGDVVVAEQVFRYDSRRKERDFATTFGPYGLQVDQKMLSHAQDLISDPGFAKIVSKRLLAVLAQPLSPNLLIGDIASGDAVVDSENMREKLLELNRKLVAVEMEAAGVLRACTTAAVTPRALIIRGISDYAADKEATDADPAGYQRRAAAAATAFALEFLVDYATVAAKSRPEQAA